MNKFFQLKGNVPGMLIILALLLISCGGADRNMADSPQYRELLDEIGDLKFEIENQWANPIQYGRVNLLGNPNRIKFENDSVEVFLPFFGERYSGGAYNHDEGAIQFKGIPKDLKLEENPDKGAVKISFEGSRGTENLDFLITVFSNGVARTSVTSTQREKIMYDGRLVDGE